MIFAIVLLLVVVVFGLFVVFGIPLIQDMFTPPITGLPTTSATNSLRARFTQTALAKTPAAILSETPLAK